MQKDMGIDEFFQEISNFTDTVYDIDVTNRFKKQINLAFKRNLNLELLKNVIYTLAKGEELAENHRQHKLTGFAENIWECHIKPDWLLIWKYSDNELVLVLMGTETHSDLF